MRVTDQREQRAVARGDVQDRGLRGAVDLAHDRGPEAAEALRRAPGGPLRRLKRVPGLQLRVLSEYKY